MRDSRHTERVRNDVDRFVEALGEGWQRQACIDLLEDVRDAACLGEHIKWGHPYFEHDGAAVTKWFCAKGWINVYFFRGRELADPQGLFERSTNRRMLTVKVTPSRLLDRSAFRDLVRMAVALAEDDDPGSTRRSPEIIDSPKET
ncbi:MAG: DUF1801 domain-containing protein [Dermatophilaceae bacterium]